MVETRHFTMATAPKATRERILVENLSVDYLGVAALQAVTLRIVEGSICGLIGRNGAGKSTLFKVLVGLLRPRCGRVRINGDNLATARRRQYMAYVPQLETVDWHFPVSVSDVVLMGRYGGMNLLRIPGRSDHIAVRQSLHRVGLWELRDRQIGELSGGQRKRAFLARALAQDASVLLLDEPFEGVDIRTETLMTNLFLQFRNEGRTLLLSTHDLNHVRGLCDQVVLINKTVLAYGDTEDVFTRENLAFAFGQDIGVETRDPTMTCDRLDGPHE